MKIPAESTPNGDQPWEFKLLPETAEAIERGPEHGSPSTGTRIPRGSGSTPSGQPYSSGAQNGVFQELLEKVGTDEGNRGLCWYSIRHTLARIVERVESREQLADPLRHANTVTQDEYTVQTNLSDFETSHSRSQTDTGALEENLRHVYDREAACCLPVETHRRWQFLTTVLNMGRESRTQILTEQAQHPDWLLYDIFVACHRRIRHRVLRCCPDDENRSFSVY